MICPPDRISWNSLIWVNGELRYHESELFWVLRLTHRILRSDSYPPVAHYLIKDMTKSAKVQLYQEEYNAGHTDRTGAILLKVTSALFYCEPLLRFVGHLDFSFYEYPFPTFDSCKIYYRNAKIVHFQEIYKHHLLQADLILPRLLYCTSQTLHSLRMEGLWQTWVKQVSWHHFSNSICWLCISVKFW